MRVLFDHPGWADGRRAVRTACGPRLAHTDPRGINRPDGTTVAVYRPDSLGPAVPEQLRAFLSRGGPVQRLRNPDLWEAIATAIIRQVIRADQARKMHRRFADRFGESAPGTGLRALPAPQRVLKISGEEFSDLGMAFKAAPLRAAAQAVLDYGEKWEQLPPTDLVAEVQSVPRVGPWTAGAAVADLTGDFSLYPYGDMAVRKYARQAFPDLGLPDQETAFAACWSSFTTSPSELSVLTVLTLALGGEHAHHSSDEPT